MRKKRPILIIIIVIILFFACCFADSNTRITTEEYQVYSQKLPEAFDGFRIVQLSDLHGAVFGKDNTRLLEEIEKAAPDVIAITGDLFDARTDEEYAPELIEKLVHIAPVYYVSGNHEWTINPRSIYEKMTEAGATVLRNKYVTLELGNETIILAGVDDPNGPYDMITKENFVTGIKSEHDDYILMLSHRNTDLELWSSLGVDTVLCGHAHGGIIRLPLVGGILVHFGDKYDYIDGSHTIDDTTEVVSRGLGNSGYVPRLFNNPEIVVVVLKCN